MLAKIFTAKKLTYGHFQSLTYLFYVYYRNISLPIFDACDIGTVQIGEMC